MFWKMHYGATLLTIHGTQAATAGTVIALGILGVLLGSLLIAGDADHPALESVVEVRRVA